MPTCYAKEAAGAKLVYGERMQTQGKAGVHVSKAVPRGYVLCRQSEAQRRIFETPRNQVRSNPRGSAQLHGTTNLPDPQDGTGASWRKKCRAWALRSAPPHAYKRACKPGTVSLLTMKSLAEPGSRCGATLSSQKYTVPASNSGPWWWRVLNV